MLLTYKKIVFGLLFNTSLFLMLIIGIQNSSMKSKVNFFLDETVNLPISFIVGTSFISGTLSGSIISLVSRSKKGSN
tara:strand:- start:543 stop:773 length:231 start_codon:yes stop_codon:yes gene_type:complete